MHSLSKRSNLAGYRCAFVAGDPAVVGELLAVRRNLGLMMPGPQQRAMVAALDDDAHVEEQHARYAARRASLRSALEAAGFRIDHSEASLYLWATRDEPCWDTVAWLAERGVLVAPGSFYGPAGGPARPGGLHRHRRAGRAAAVGTARAVSRARSVRSAKLRRPPADIVDCPAHRRQPIEMRTVVASAAAVSPAVLGGSPGPPALVGVGDGLGPQATPCATTNCATDQPSRLPASLPETVTATSCREPVRAMSTSPYARSSWRITTCRRCRAPLTRARRS